LPPDDVGEVWMTTEVRNARFVLVLIVCALEGVFDHCGAVKCDS